MQRASTTACIMTQPCLMCCPWSPAQPRSPMPAGTASCCGEPEFRNACVNKDWRKFVFLLCTEVACSVSASALASGPAVSCSSCVFSHI